MRFDQVLDADVFVDRHTSVSYIDALPDPERASVIERLRTLAAGVPEQPIRLGYTTEAYVYRRA